MAKHQANFGIIAAVPNELRYIKESCTDLAELDINGVKYTTGRLDDQPVVMVAAGIGTTCTAAVTSNLAKDFELKSLFFIGTAGALNQDLQNGDVVVGDSAFEIEIQGLHDAFLNTPFEPGLTHSFKNEHQKLSYSADPALLSKVNLMNADFNIITGPLASTNEFNTPIDKINQCRQLGAVAIDMESSAFYQVGWLFNLPCLVIRGISNVLIDSGNPNEVEVDMDIAEKNSAFVLTQLIQMMAE